MSTKKILALMKKEFNYSEFRYKYLQFSDA